jgi:hypothetical protein
MGKNVFYGFFFVCVKSHGKIIINVILLNPFVGIAKMFLRLCKLK